ncbi:tail fiber domain-containing protein [Flagellimonas onchidii]|uniref:tail fiber domain-containing protein n=1 Tax=Flagellimonas onchidii TaxID=2562684 RepID=UPI0010A5D3DB|nr:tail fiber domain-containing protein [Allomuricauda onchidii]
MPRLTDKSTLTAVQDTDLLHVVDVSDTTSSPQGTSKKVSRYNLLNSFTGFDSRYYTKTIIDDLLTNKNNWETAFGWGDHSTEGYLTSETDPIFTASQAANITSQHITDLNNLSGANTGDQDLSPYQLLSEKGQANGYVPLNGSGQIPTQYLPDGIDDVLEFADLASFPATGESGKIYLAIDTNFTYRWSGSTYVQVGGGQAPVDSVFGRTGVITALSGDYSAFYAPLSHTHDWIEITGKPTTFTPSAHTHTTSDITNLSSYTGFDSRYLGISAKAADSDLLDGVDGSNYARKDTSSEQFFNSRIAIQTTTPILSLRDTNSTGNAHTGYISLKDSGNSERGWIGFGDSTNNYLSLSNTYDTVNGVRINNQWRVWHEGNDGSGSGLDADLLDGRQTTVSGNRWDVIPIVSTIGTMDIGRYIDFHRSDADASDWELRLDAVSTSTLRLLSTASNAMFEAYKSSEKYARLESNNSGGVINMASSGFSNTIIRSYGTSDFYGGNIHVHNGDIKINGNSSPAKLILNGDTGNIDDDGREDCQIDFLNDAGTNGYRIGVENGAGSSNMVWHHILNGTPTERMRLSNLGNLTVSGLITANGGVTLGSGDDLSLQGSGSVINHNTTSSRDKIRVWNSNLYTIGMQSGVTFGSLSDYAMTFQMNNDSDRGFWWGDDAHGVNQGAMALSTNGYLTVANHARFGYSETDTSSVSTTYTIQANGTVQATNFILSSDQRLKENIEDYYPKPISVKWKTFDWIEGDKKQIGVIAQELQEKHPEFVVEDDHGMLSVKYTDLLIAKMAEKDNQIENLENEVQQLKTKLDLLIKELL